MDVSVRQPVATRETMVRYTVMFISSLVPDDQFVSIYAGNYRLRFFFDDIKWLFLIVPCHLPFIVAHMEESNC